MIIISCKLRVTEVLSQCNFILWPVFYNYNCLIKRGNPLPGYEPRSLYSLSFKLFLNSRKGFSCFGLFFFILFLVFYNGRVLFCLMGNSFFFEWEVYRMNGCHIRGCFFFDWMGFLFLAVVSLIRRGVLYYCVYYMDRELNCLRFLFILLIFIFSIFLLIVRPNIVSILIGWDGLGLSSYLLVIYYQNVICYNSGILTVLSNRVGDVSILLFISAFFFNGSWRLILRGINGIFISFFLILAAVTKRAQVPFSAWLPAAISAPTPVSSLVHSSTLVTAGVFLLIRFFHLLEGRGAYWYLFYLGLVRTSMRGLSANFESDLKKVIALSTLSQLGLMFITLGRGNPYLGFFHLMAHALFKSTLFICGGFVIHRERGCQDFRKTGSFFKRRPILGSVLVVSNLALCGFPYISGFFSKDLIAENRFFLVRDFFFFFFFFILYWVNY